jgi:hypothetical protein
LSNDSGLKISDNGVTDAMLQTITVSDKVSGSAVQLASSGGLSNDSGLKISDSGVTNSMLQTITTTNKVSGSAVQLATDSAIEDSTGLRLKTTLGDTGLTLTDVSGDQKLSVDANQSQITSIGQTGQTLSIPSKIIGADASFANVFVAANQIEDGGIVYTDASGKLLTESSFKYNATTDTMTVSNLDIVSGANFNDNDIANVAISSGSISGTDVDMTNGTFTTTAAQKKTILEGAESNIDFGNYDICANSVFINDSLDVSDIYVKQIRHRDSINGIEFQADGNINFDVLPITSIRSSDLGGREHVFITKAIADTMYQPIIAQDANGDPITLNLDVFFKKDYDPVADNDPRGNLYVEDITMYGSFITNDVSINTNLYVENKITVPRVSGFTVEGAIDFSNQDMNNVAIKSGAIENTDITVGSSKTLNVSAGSLVTSNTQNLNILQGASSNVDFGTYDISAQSVTVGTNGLTVNTLNSTRVPFLDVSKKLVDHTDLTYDSGTSTLNVSNLSGFTATDTIDFDTNNMNNVAIKSGAIENTDVTVGSSKTLNVSAGSLVTSDTQNLNILQGASSNVDFGTYDISAQSVTVGTNGLTMNTLNSTRVPFLDGSNKLVDHADLTYDSGTSTLKISNLSGFTATGAIDFNTQPMTNVNIDSGSINGTDIDVSGLLFTTSPAQNLAIIQGADQDVNFGSHTLSVLTLSAYTLTSANGLSINTETDFLDNSLNNVAIKSGTISGTDVDMTGKIFTTSPSQNLDIIQGAGQNVNFGSYDVSAGSVSTSTLNATTINGFTAGGAIDVNNETMTNVNITSGSVAGSTVQLSSITALEDSTGLKLKQTLAGSGLSWNNTGSDQVLDLSPSNITSVGTLTGLEVSGNAVFTNMAEKLNNISGSNTIDYNNGSVVYLTPSGTGPFTYSITNVPDLGTQSHVITVITKSTGAATSDYATTVTINSTSYNLLWNSGSLPELDTTTGDIITQQFSILPTNLASSPNVVLTNVSYYKTAS